MDALKKKVRGLGDFFWYCCKNPSLVIYLTFLFKRSYEKGLFFGLFFQILRANRQVCV